MNTQTSKFPPGGEREPVYSFLRANGFVMSQWSDKHWTRADGLQLYLYGSGSKAVIREQDGTLLTDDNLEPAIWFVTPRPS